MFKSASTCEECREVGEGGRLGSLLGCCRGGGGVGGGHEMKGVEHEERSRSSSTNCRFVLTLSWSSTSEPWSEYPEGELGACECVSL